MSEDKAFMSEFLFEYLLRACEDYKIAHRADLMGRQYACPQWLVSPQEAKKSIFVFFVDWFDTDTACRLCRQLREDAVKEKRGRYFKQYEQIQIIESG